MNPKTKLYSATYKAICKKLGVTANNSILRSLNNYEIILGIENLQDKDIRPIAAALPHLSLIKRVCISNVDSSKSSIPHSKSNHIGSLTSRSDIKITQKSNFESNFDTHSTLSSYKDDSEVKKKIKGIRIFKAISENLQRNKVLTVIKISQIALDFEAWQFLGKGFNETLPLVSLMITQCKLSDKCFSAFSVGLTTLNCLKVLDLSENDLEDCGFDLARIISRQNERSNEII